MALDFTPLDNAVTRLREGLARGCDVWVFGSRARRAAKPHSDVDLAVAGDAPLDMDQLAALNDAFAQSDLPWKVDVLHWARTSDAFKAHILQHRVLLQARRA